MSQGFELYIMTRTDFSDSSRITRIEMVIEKVVYPPLNHMTRLLAREYFIDCPIIYVFMPPVLLKRLIFRRDTN